MSSDSTHPNRPIIILGVVIAVIVLCGGFVVAFLGGLFLDNVVDVSSIAPWTTNHTFEIKSDRGWQESGIRVSQGEVIHVTYQSGQWRVADWAEYTEAQGYSRFEGYAPSIAHGALIARISNGPITPILKEAWFTADRDGVIAFRINDADKFLYDNMGTIEVSVKIN